jgi:high-affinity Fe2+/Pb2+ permease
MHKGHLTTCGLMLAVAVGFLILTGGSTSGLGLVVVALVCPLAMIVAMKLLMGDQRADGHHEAAEPAPGQQADLEPR